MIMRRSSSSPKPHHADSENQGLLPTESSQKGSNVFFKIMGFLAAFLLLLPMILFTGSVVYQDSPSAQIRGVVGTIGFHAKSWKDRIHGAADRIPDEKEEKGSNVPIDKLLGGLLAAGFDECPCLSRYQSSLYRNASTHRPSAYLLQRLRKYEELHKKCGPSTKAYHETVKQLKSGRMSGTADCKYVVWIAYSGLGNRILTIASAFLYALLTNKVLLIDRQGDMAHLFCEPFPNTSWLLPPDFPLIDKLKTFKGKSSKSFGKMVKHNILNDSASDISTGSLPMFTYLHLAHDYDDYDKLFFCEQDQLLLQEIPWLILRSDNYFIPSLFLIPMFEQELAKLFPEKDTIFHHLGRYLFHPSNSVWGLITRYYQAYLANAEERIGMQIRIFETGPGPFQHVLDQILACSLNKKVLPEVTRRDPVSSTTVAPRRKAVLVTGLSSWYSDKVKEMYWEHPTVNGEAISVFQPSHEEFQQTEKQMHNMKAWAEMYLLSVTDVLITSSWSTFGYVAQGLGGLKPWILFKPENKTAPDPPCRRAMSMEPCFHAPPFYDCKAKRGIDTGALVPHVRHCEDVSWGLKVVDSKEL